MKKPLLLLAALAASSMGMAQEVGRVISATPVIEQVGVPRNVCTTEQVAVQQPKSGAGAVMGAIAGGAMGNAIGGGEGRALATMFGLMGGAILGDRIEGPSATQTRNVQRCATQTFYENRPVAYNVVYEYAGKQYNVQMPQDPGPTISLNVTPVGMDTPRGAPMDEPVAQEPVYSEPVYNESPRVVLAAPVNIQFGTTYYRRAQPAYPVVIARRDDRDGRRDHRQRYDDGRRQRMDGWR